MEIGQTIPNIQLPAIDGSNFDNQSLAGKRYLITFFRFATCPFCNMRVAELVRIKKDLGEAFEVVAIFEAELSHLKKYASKHLAQFPILADEDRLYYQSFGVKKSFLGMLKGMVFRFGTVLKGLLAGYIPREVSSRMFIMPLSILVDEQGVVREVYHGKDEGDHMPLEQIKTFAHGA
ncbi:redoxin domain-containing protein [Paraglaciecola sp.]|uniref:redoxin domain-containing protein n=1 Tax=Paraglaciecola sp. TaxID=1920173 RepID=UPI003EF21C15